MKMNQEPEEFCMNCGAKIFPYERRCPFCGKMILWSVEEIQKIESRRKIDGRHNQQGKGD